MCPTKFEGYNASNLSNPTVTYSKKQQQQQWNTWLKLTNYEMHFHMCHDF